MPECSLNLEDKIEMFSLRTEMNSNPYNFGNKENCELDCLIPQDNEHYLNCNILNEGIENDMKYSKKFNGPLETKIRILRKIQENKKRRKKVTSRIRLLLVVNPLYYAVRDNKKSRVGFPKLLMIFPLNQSGCHKIISSVHPIRPFLQSYYHCVCLF